MRLAARCFSTFLLLAALSTTARAGDVSVKLDAGSGFVLKDSAGAIERLRVDEASGNISRNGALFVHTTGDGSTFVGRSAGPAAFGPGNTAVGFSALKSVSYGYYNSAFGWSALYANKGSFNSAFGNGAMASAVNSYSNSAFGYSALRLTRFGAYNAGFGMSSLRQNTDGSANTALGSGSLYFNTVGSDNTAVGAASLSHNNVGSRNVGIGSGAGYNQTTGSDNIYLKNTGVAGENGQIRIGTVGTHTATHVAGIHGATSAGGIAVLVDASGTLGTTSSSARFKQEVEDLGEASDLLMKLRPVRFHYLEETVGAEEAKTTQYGLIAEEVAEVAPELVALDLHGRPYSVKYHVLPALLLGEVQAQRRINEEQRRIISALTQRIERLETR